MFHNSPIQKHHGWQTVRNLCVVQVLSSRTVKPLESVLIHKWIEYPAVRPALPILLNELFHGWLNLFIITNIVLNIDRFMMYCYTDKRIIDKGR